MDKLVIEQQTPVAAGWRTAPFGGESGSRRNSPLCRHNGRRKISIVHFRMMPPSSARSADPWPMPWRCRFARAVSEETDCAPAQDIIGGKKSLPAAPQLSLAFLLFQRKQAGPKGLNRSITWPLAVTGVLARAMQKLAVLDRSVIVGERSGSATGCLETDDRLRPAPRQPRSRISAPCRRVSDPKAQVR